MVRLRHSFCFSFLALGACVTPSKSLGAADSTSADGSGDDTTTAGDSECAPHPAFDCVTPLDRSEGLCSDDPSSTFDANCCMRPSCESSDECDAGLVCVPTVLPWSCTDMVEDGEMVCRCGTPPNGKLRSTCVPPEDVPEQWCSNYWPEEECNSALPIEAGPVGQQFCRWIEPYIFTVDAEPGECTIAGPAPRCMTFDANPELGCGPLPCTKGAVSMSTAIAREIGPGAFEVFGLNDVFCGEASPVGDWIPADDPSLAQCAMTCSFDNPCGIPLGDYLVLRTDASKDAPVDDCGHVTPDDSLADWQAAHDCAVQHATAGEGFLVVADLEGIDSLPQLAFIGMQGESYATSRFPADTGGIDAGTLFEEPGAGLEALADCEVAVGELCLGLVTPGELVQLCPT